MNRTLQFIRKRWLLSILALAFTFSGYHIYVLRNGDPFKVTDPDDPRFDPMKYEGRDYKDSPDLWIKAVKKVMPQGTSLETISTIMKNDDPCFNMSRHQDFPNMISFVCSSSIKYPKGQNRIFIFDKDNKLLDYFGGGARGIYTKKFPSEIKGEYLKIRKTADE